VFIVELANATDVFGAVARTDARYWRAV